MTDKQIIIDDVPVQDCCYFDYENDGYEDSCYIHQNECSAQNCYYKQLKRKEQECEELKEECNEYFELMAIRTEVLAKIANKLGMNTGIIENNELFCKIDQLKAENKHINDLLNQALKELEKTIETLTEIKEIANYSFDLSTSELLAKLEQILQKISEVENERKENCN